MAETLRDMVVSLSLNSDNFSANLRSINAQLKEADSEFKAAAAGVQGFENTTAGAQAKLEQLNQKFKLQQQAVQQYEKALEKAQQKLETSAQTHDKLTQKLDEAKQKHSDLGQEVERLTQELDQAKAAGLEGTDAYNQMETELQQLKEEYAQSGQEVEKLEAQLQKSDAAMQKNADGVTRAQTNLNNAKAALQSTGAEIDATASRLQKMQSAWTQAADKMAAFGKKASEVGKNLEGAGRNVSKVSAVAAAAGTAAVVTFASYDDAIRQVYATMGLSASENADQMEALSAAAQEMGASTRYSASEAASALNYLALAGYSSDQAIGALPTVLRLAQAGGIDLASASDMVTDSMSALGLEMSEMPTFADQMAKASQKSNTSVAQLGEGILKVSATAKNLKGGTVELNTVLGILADNGIKGAEGGTHLRNMILSLQNPTDKAAAQLKTLGVNVYDAEGKMRGLDEIFGDLQKAMGGMTDEARDAALSEIFNKTDLAAVGAMLSNCGDRFDELSAEIENSQGVAENMADMMEGGIGGAFRSFKSAVEGLAISFGDTLAPMVQSVAEHITEYVRKFTEADEGTKKMVVTIGAVVAAAGPALLILGKLISSVGTIATAISKGMTAVSGFAGAIGSFAGSLSLANMGMGLLVASAVVGIGMLADWASGARAARDAQAQLNETVKEWGDNVTTAYEKSKGMQAFGLTAEDFSVGGGADDGGAWLEQTLATWSDGKAETDEIVAETVKGFTDGTDKIRTALDSLKEAGGGGTIGDLDGDISKLDEIDQEVQSILEKRQNGYLSEDDTARLQELINQREAIQVKYQLVSDAGDAFDQINQGVEAAMSRGADGGKTFADAYAAATQGVQSFKDSLNQEYDARYKVISAMEEGEAKQQALGELQTWYNEQAVAGEEAYANAVQQAADATGVFAEGGQYDTTIQGIEQVQAAMDQLASASTEQETAAATEALNEALAGMDESSVVETTAALVAMQEAGAELTPSMEGALTALESIKSLMSGGEDLFGDSFESLNQLFGEGLDSEVFEISATLGTDALSEQYTAWAEGEHTPIIPSIDQASLEGQSITIDVKGNITEALAASGATFTIDAKGNVTEVGWPEGSEYTVDAKGNITEVTTPDGSKFTVDAEGSITSVTKADGTTFTVDASGNITGITTADGVSFTVDGKGNVTAVNPAAGLTFEVDGDGRVVHTELADSATFEVDGDGNVTNVIVQDGVTYTVDGKGNVTSVTTAAGITYTIDGKGKVTSVSTADGVTYTVDGTGQITAVALSPDVVLPTAEISAMVKELTIDSNTKFSNATGEGLDTLFRKSESAVQTNQNAATPILNKITSSDAEAVSKYAEAVRNYNSVAADSGASGSELTRALEQTNAALPAGTSMFSEWTETGNRAAEAAAYIATGMQKVQDGTITAEDATELQTYMSNLSTIGEFDPSALESIATAFSQMDTIDGTFFEGVDVSGLSTAFQSAADSIDPSVFQSKGQEAANAAVAGMEGADASSAGHGVVDGYTQAVSAGTGEAQSAGHELGAAAPEGVNEGAGTHSPSTKTQETGRNVVAGLAQGMRNTGTVASAGRMLGTAATNAVRSALPSSAWSSVGSQAMAGLAAGIRSGASSVISAAAAAAASALAAAKNALGISSPSKVFRDEVGKMVMKGLGEGIVDETDAQARIIANASRHLTETAQGAVGGVTNNRATYNQQSSISFAGATFIIRNESDIHELAVEITDLTRKRQRAYGS